MSATLTWKRAGLQTKTNTTVASFFTDLNSLVTSKAGDAAYKWQVASVNDASTPFYIVLKRKDASNGRILLVSWTSAPAGNNSAILDAAPSTSAVFIAWFPNGNVDTPSNLTASSGTILGNDTGAVKVACGQAISTVYGANVQLFYFDSAEAMVFGMQNPSGVTAFACGAGDLLVDASDNAFGCTFSTGASVGWLPGSSSLAQPWTTSQPSAGSSSPPNFRTNAGSSNRSIYHAYVASGVWANQAVGSADILTDTSLNKAWFVPIPLLGNNIKGEGFIYKLRQIALGPGSTGPFAVYNLTGPVTAAQQFNAATTGTPGAPWMVDFKI